MTHHPIVESILEQEGAGLVYFRRHAGSLDVRVLLSVFGSLALFSLMVAAGFALSGAWLIIPFAGLEVAGLAVAFFVILRRAGDFERVALSGDRVLVEFRERGRAGQFEFHRCWARLVTGEAGSVALSSHGRTVEIGRYCSLEGRRALALELRGWLGGHRI